MEVKDVLVACKTEVEQTHWCQGHYENTVAMLGEPEEFEEFVKSLPSLWRLDILPDGETEYLYKVQHCLVGMINSYLDVATERLSTDPVHPDADPSFLTWVETINRVGLVIYGDYWDSNRRMTLVGDDEEGNTIETWNDAKTTTREMVLEVLDRSIGLEMITG